MFCSNCGAKINRPSQEAEAPISEPISNNVNSDAQGQPVYQAANYSSSTTDSATPKTLPKKKLAIFGLAAALVVVLVVVLTVSVSSCSQSSSDESSKSSPDSEATNSALPTNAYDIAGILGMNPSDMESWLNQNNFVTYDGGGNSFARALIDGTKEVPASTDPSANSGWQTLSIQGYTFYSYISSGSNIEDLFNNSSAEISPSSLAASQPVAITYTSTERAKDSSSLPSSTKNYLEKLLSQASLTPVDIKSDSDEEDEDYEDEESRSYAIGSCHIDGKDGIWIAYTEMYDENFYGYILCGYADEMKSSLDIDGATSSALATLIGWSDSRNSGSSSTSDGDEEYYDDEDEDSDESDYSNNSTYSDSSGNNSYSYGNSSSGSSLAGSWRDPQYGDTMTLDSNGTAVITQDGKRFAGSWSPTSNGMTFIMGGGKTYSFVLGSNGGKATLYNSDKQLYFEKL